MGSVYHVKNMMSNRVWITIAIGLAMLLGSCSSYEKLLKSRDHELMYQKALEYYAIGNHYRYTTLFELISPIYRGTQRADTIEFYLARGHYNQGDYLLAGHYFNQFRRNFPRSVFTEEATYMYAYCYYRASPRPLLDQEPTRNAIAAFNEFFMRYPNSKHREEANVLLAELKEKLEERAFLSAKLYFDMGEYKAAIPALKNSLQDYPNSKYREEQLFLIFQASYLLADNSIPSLKRQRFQNTMDEYFNLISEFPNTKYLREAQRIHASVARAIGTPVRDQEE